MKIERFAAEDMSHAMRMVKAAMGADAVILSNLRKGDQVEVLAAADYDERLLGAIAPPSAGEKAPADPGNEVKSVDVSTNVLKAELASLQETLRTELAGLRAEKEKSRLQLEASSVRQLFQERLLDLGFSGDIAGHLAKKVPPGINRVPGWGATLKLIGGLLRVGSNAVIDRGGVYAFVGSTGVGKTTTVAKLASQFSFRHGASEVALITTDTMRLGGLEQLSTFARTLGVPLSMAGNVSELKRAVNEYRHKKLVLVDTAGMSQSDLELSSQMAHYKEGVPDLKICVVLSSIVQNGVTEEIIRSLSGVPISSAIITKTDETLQLGPVLSGIIKSRLPVSYVCNGQNIPEDIEPASRDLLCRSVYALMKEHTELPSSTGTREMNLHV
jgi:flagellar biosynthesis protein FlhF